MNSNRKPQDKHALFESVPVPRAVMTLAIPTVISSLVMVLYNLADTYFVGFLNDPVQTAAVNLAAPVLLAFNAVNNLFGVGASSMLSRALGRREEHTARQSAATGFFCALVAAVLFSLGFTVFKTPLLSVLGTDAVTVDATSEYLFWTVTCGAAPSILNVVLAYLVRAEGSTLHAGIGTMSGCLLNMVLDPIFILPWGLDMGAAGAGCATFVANCVACTYFFVLLISRRGRTSVSLSPRDVKLGKVILVGICAVGIPAAIQNLLNVVGMTILNNFASSYGIVEAVSGMGIAQKVNMIPLQVAMGFSQGIMPLIGYCYAAGNISRMKEAFKFTVKVTMAFLLSVAALYWVFAPGLLGLFMENPTVVEYGAAFLRGMCLAVPVLVMDFLAVGVFQACGLGKYSLLFAILRKVVLEIPALFLLNYLFPLYGLAYAQLAAELVLSVAAVVVLARLFKKFQREAESRKPAAQPPAEA